MVNSLFRERVTRKHLIAAATVALWHLTAWADKYDVRADNDDSIGSGLGSILFLPLVLAITAYLLLHVPFMWVGGLISGFAIASTGHAGFGWAVIIGSGVAGYLQHQAYKRGSQGSDPDGAGGNGPT